MAYEVFDRWRFQWKSHLFSRMPRCQNMGFPAYKLVLLTVALLSAQGILAVSDLSAQSTSDRVSKLINERLETRKPPLPLPETIPPSPPVDVNGAPSTDTDEESANEAGTTSPNDLTSGQQPKPEKFIPPKLYAGKELIHAATMLTRFYEARAYRPAWSSEGSPLPQADAVVRTIQEEVEREGWRPTDYHLAKLKTLLTEVREGSAKAIDPLMLVDLDFLLTDAFLTYGAAVSVGQTNLDTLTEHWFTRHEETDLVHALQTALETDRIEDTLKALPPQQVGYQKLHEVLARYRDLAAHGGWPTIPSGPALQKGDRGGRVAKLRARLIATGDLDAKARDSDGLFDEAQTASKPYEGLSDEGALFDEAVEQAVRKFQQRHGLPPNGIVGVETLAALNVSAETRRQQIAINMERWRKLPRELGSRYIEVNVPNFALEVIENGQPIMDMKVVVGKMIEERSTPVFSAKMTYLVLNPIWHVPKKIAEKELFPLSRKKPGYFAKNNFNVRRIPAGVKQVPDPNAIDGSMMSVTTYDYLLRQEPGPKNALGRVKFMFPNAYSVYLHDTPAKELFNRTVRAFSHGCIRIEKPIDLAEYVLRGAPKWTRSSILSTIQQDKERTVWLPEPIPVYIQYWTAWVDRDGVVQFRNDIYHYDGLMPQSSSKSQAKPRPQVSPGRPKAQPVIQPSGRSATQPAI